MSPRFEAFVARLYVDEGLRRRFLADARGEATRAGLSPNEILAAERIDRTGLELAAANFANKRRHAAHRLRSRWRPICAWASGLNQLLLLLIAPVVLFSPLTPATTRRMHSFVSPCPKTSFTGSGKA